MQSKLNSDRQDGVVTLIEGCVLDYICPREWDKLARTDIPSVRHCAACSKPVTFCTEWAMVEDLTEKGQCVAFEFKPSKPGQHRITMGIRHPSKEARQASIERLKDVEL